MVFFKSHCESFVLYLMGLLPEIAFNCVLRMCRECRERFPRHRLQRKPLISDPGMHNGGGGNVPGIPGACATRNFTYLAKCPWTSAALQFPHAMITISIGYSVLLTVCEARAFITSGERSISKLLKQQMVLFRHHEYTISELKPHINSIWRSL